MVPCITDSKLAQFKGMLDGASKVAVLGHTHPDGDAIGSTTALCVCLRDLLGKAPIVIYPDTPADNLLFIPDPGIPCIFADKFPAEALSAIEGSDIVMQIGSNDDSLAVVNTEAIKKANRRLKGDQLTAKLQEAYEKGMKVVFSTVTKIPVKDTLFTRRADFCIDSLKYIPFSGGMEVEMESTIKKVSGVQVPLFEARMPYKALLKGMDNQLRINLDADRKAQNKYEGLQVGSITAPNNNAGNWE